MIVTRHYTTVMQTLLQEGKSGKFELKREVITKGAWMRMYTPAGYFYIDRFNKAFPMMLLTEEPGAIWMSDTPMEQEGLKYPTLLAKGDTLILGLGIGLLPTLLRTRNRGVRSITIVEKEQDVIDLVYDKIKFGKTSIVHANAEDFLFTTPNKYDFIFIDVWGSLIAPIKQIGAWTELAKPALAEDGMIRCWLQEIYDRIKPRLPKKPIPREESGDAAVREPCMMCGKRLRFDYAGLCMDCADLLEVSEAFVKKQNTMEVRDG